MPSAGTGARLVSATPHAAGSPVGSRRSRLRDLVVLGDRLAASLDDPRGVPAVLADAAEALPCDLVVLTPAAAGGGPDPVTRPDGLLAVRHADPLVGHLATAAVAGGVDRVPGPAGDLLRSVARTCRPVRRSVPVTRDGAPDPALAAAAVPGADRAVLERVRPRHLVAVPVHASGEVLAVLSVVRGPNRPAFDDEDVDYLSVLARRAAMTWDYGHKLREVQCARGIMDAFDSRAAVLDGAGVVVTANHRWTADAGGRGTCVCGPVPAGENWFARLARSSDPDLIGFGRVVGEVIARHRPLARYECRCGAGGSGMVTAIEVTALAAPGEGAVVVQTDVSMQRRLQDELSHRATHDDLTGLPNRAALVERLGLSLRRLHGQALLAVLFIDLDGFKDINDGLGHAVGDQVLVAVARRLRQRCRAADVVARFGGDEFVVVLPVPDVARALATADRLVEALEEPIAVGDAEVAPGASIGVAVVDSVPPGDDPVGTVLRDADTAMYHAKERGRGRYEVYDAGLRKNIAHRLEYASALRRAVGNDELRLVYQSKRHCGDRRVAGVEALLRWRHPVLGEVPPGTFIPVAERTGRIVEVGGWALKQALRELAVVPDRRLTVAVNVSPRQLTAPRLVEQVDAALASSGLEPWRLVLEITESALVDEPASARALLRDLRRLGVLIALDDFGTGWSSMSYLRTLPFDILKIDRSFVADLPHDPDACAVVAAVLGLGHGMGLVVVAEGVEGEEQLDVLRDMGCDEYQGFIDGRPGPLTDALRPT